MDALLLTNKEVMRKEIPYIYVCMTLGNMHDRHNKSPEE